MQPSQQSNILGYVSLILGILSLALVCLFAVAGLVEFIDSVTGMPPHGLLPVNRAYARQVIWSEGIAVAGIASGVAALLKKESGSAVSGFLERIERIPPRNIRSIRSRNPLTATLEKP